MRRWVKKGFIWRADSPADWWDVAAMAPAPLDLLDGRLRVFVGGWKTGGAHPVSRIGYVDVCADNPAKVLGFSRRPVADIGPPGTYSDAGVFPAHVLRLADGRIYLYTTGFQHSQHAEIDHLHFSGLLRSEDNGKTFAPYSQAPVLDRADEGLHIRAGLSAVEDEKGGFHAVYAVGGGFKKINGKNRANYDVRYQHSPDGIRFAREGRTVATVDRRQDYAWGRPQLIQMDGRWLVFAARRLLSGFFHIGCASSADLLHWQKELDWVKPIARGVAGEFDDQSVYYPAVCKSGGRVFLFYSGNGFGRAGLGWAELTADG